MLKKVGMAAAYIAIGCLIYVYGSDILQWLQSADNLVLVTLMATVMALFPVIPYPVVGGVIGAALGPMAGGVVTWAGSAMASILIFAWVRYGYAEWGSRLLHGQHRLGRVTAMFERNAFLAILFSRLIPVIPSIFINVYAALSTMSFLSYSVASSLGKIPAMLLFVLVGDNLMTNPSNIILTVGIYAVFLGVTLWIYKLAGFGPQARAKVEPERTS